MLAVIVAIEMVGLLHSAMLAGYLAGQLPAGLLADRFGGERLLLLSLALWSAALLASGAAAAQEGGFTLLLATRAAFGLVSASAMPGVSAMAAEWVPRHARAGAVASVYSAFNLGGVVGLAGTPLISASVGALGALSLAAATGAAWATVGWRALAGARAARGAAAAAAAAGSADDAAAATAAPLHASCGSAATATTSFVDADDAAAASADPSTAAPADASTSAATATDVSAATAAAVVAAAAASSAVSAATAAAVANAGSTHAAPPSSLLGIDHVASSSAGATPGSSPSSTGREEAAARDGSGDQGSGPRSGMGGDWAQLATLCWAHAVPGWSFFVLSSWLPMYLGSLGVESPQAAGLLAAAPFAATALATTLAGAVADALVGSGARVLSVRRVMHAVSTLGCAVCLAPLALLPSITPLGATVCVVAAQICYAASFGGFHAYVQDVAPRDAGLVLGMTNSCSIAMGIIGNLSTGVIVEATGSYRLAFAVPLLMYVSSFALFMGLLRGQPIRLRKPEAERARA
ncbi:hypothetical protein FOA52_010799 [Chlamydomonas sp. UWO 241]|nr:hypothetical protein FOA52_010799 [Chlamydomonas sp. UWO 241]